MSDGHHSPPSNSGAEEHAEGSEAAPTIGSSDDAATLSYNQFEPFLRTTQELAVGHATDDLTVEEHKTQELTLGHNTSEWSTTAEAAGQGTVPRQHRSGQEENRRAASTTQAVIHGTAVIWHGSDPSISQGSTLTATSKEYYSSSDISQRSQASILHNVQYHSPLEQLQQRRGQPLVVPHSRPELMPESSTGTWSDPEQHTPELTRQSPIEAFWSTRGHLSSSSESNMSPPATTRILGREISSLSNLSSHSHYSERSTEHSEEATPPRHSNTPSERHVVHSSQGSYPQESFETREEAPQTPAIRKPMYVQSTFIEELTPEMMRHSEEEIVWSSSPSKRAAERHRRSQRIERSPRSPSTRVTSSRQAGPLPQMVLRSYPRANRAHYTLLFTGMESGPSLTRDKNLVDHLGGTIVEDWQECSHLITGEIRKTMRCLCVIAAGKPVVSLEWIRACRREQRFVDETPYLLRSVISRPVFQDKQFFMTEKAPISKSDLRELATAGSGKVLQQEPSELHKDILIVGIPGHHDKQHMRLKALGYQIISKPKLIEMILQ